MFFVNIPSIILRPSMVYISVIITHITHYKSFVGRLMVRLSQSLSSTAIVKACIINPRRDTAFYNLNCNIEFSLLNEHLFDNRLIDKMNMFNISALNKFERIRLETQTDQVCSTVYSCNIYINYIH